MYEALTSSAHQSVDALAQAAEQKTTDLTSQLAASNNSNTALQAQVTTDAATITSLQASVSSLSSQLASAKPFPGFFPNLQKRTDWSAGSTGPLIGGQVPAAYSRTWDSGGNLVLNTTGVKGQWDDWLTAIHVPAVVTLDSTFARVEYTLTLDANQGFVQCHEFDAIFVIGGYKYLGGMQINYPKNGLINVSMGNGGWADTTVAVGRLTAGQHTMRCDYTFDQVAKTYTYVAFTLDGKRYPINNTQTALATTWRDGFLTIQLQEDTNSLGGSFQTTYTNIQALVI